MDSTVVAIQARSLLVTELLNLETTHRLVLFDAEVSNPTHVSHSAPVMNGDQYGRI